MQMLKNIWERPAVRRVTLVGAVILAFFLTLVLTLPEINKTEPLTVTLTEETPTPAETTEAVQSDQATPELVVNRPETEFSKELTLRELGINDVTLKGLYSSDSIWIPLPTNWIVESLLVNLHYSPSPLLYPGRANLNILVNGQEITSFNLNGEGEQVMLFKIPVGYIDQGNGFLLSFKGYLRLTDIICEETDNPGQWVNILDTTEFIMDANPNDIPPLLENMSILMNPQEDANATIFILPDSPDSTVLSTAASVAARLGFVDGRETPRVVTTSSLSDSDLTNSNLVFVGVPDDLPLLYQLADTFPARLEEGYFITLDDAPAPEEHGIVQIMRSPWNKSHTILVVSAGNEAGLRLAGNAFASHELFKILTGPYQFIKDEYELVNSFTSTPWRYSPATLADFEYEENRELGGVSASSASFYLRWPPGWTVDEGAQFNLSLIVSPVLEPNSHVVILINNVIVGVSPIDSDVTMQSFTFDLPAETINQTLLGSQQRTMKLKVRVISILDTDECDNQNDITAWIQIESDSYFTMLHSYRALPNLQTFPFPFVSDRSIQPVVIIVPDDPTEQEIATGLAVSKQLGDYTLDDFNISLLTSSQLNPEAHSNAHLIVLGTYNRQPWIEKFLKTLPPVPEDGVYQALNDENIGLIIEGFSPWNTERMLLFVLSQSTVGFEQGINLLRELYELEKPSFWMEFEIK